MKKTYAPPRMMAADPSSFDCSFCFLLQEHHRALAWLADQSPTRCISAVWLDALERAYALALGGPECLCDPDESAFEPCENGEYVFACDACGLAR
jgi:hypothetical protein